MSEQRRGVEKIGPGGPIKWQGFDENGNYGIIYESGAETWLSRELLEHELMADPKRCPRCGGDMARSADTPWITRPTAFCAQCVADKERDAWFGAWMDRLRDGNYEDYET